MKDTEIALTVIQHLIYIIRNERVLLDRDIAKLYDVTTFQIKRAVRRNIERFPQDFMFELSKKEYDSLRRQFGVLKKGEHSKYLPYAFTEQGVAMLSSVLRSKSAVGVNIQIMRAFVKLRKLISSHEELLTKVEAMEKKYDRQFQVVFEAIKQLMKPVVKPIRKIGFRIEQKGKS